jgi:3-hydroxybutyryl-CoA dehydratase
MPGPGSIYVGQNLQFRRPVKVGSQVDVHLEIKELNEVKKFVTIATTASVEGKTVLTGEALVMVPAE